MLQDPLYRDVQASVEQSGAPADKILPLYEINRATEQEKQTIRNDVALTDEQKAQKLETVQTARENALRKVLGEEIYQRFLQQNTKP
ncbi:MAG: hypothetical protein DME24_20380 [Verrucomicrobia bacterium]|nr:MAG: hypothetical protein DME24_20380 [Verrucomicrobiota bacterium]